MPVGSKLLYVALTRARTKTIVLTLGSTLPPLYLPACGPVRRELSNAYGRFSFKLRLRARGAPLVVPHLTGQSVRKPVGLRQR